ncbi:MAG: hypothetical protein LBL09_04985 [Oscillospiraceae bacterium]|nr:hypothetical protein [Oscillospiraceae bacterium]
MKKILTFLLIVLLTGEILYNFIWNYYPYKEFIEKRPFIQAVSGQFGLRLPIEEIDFTQYPNYLNTSFSDTTVLLERTINYYDKPNGTIVKVIKPGEYRLTAVMPEEYGAYGDIRYGYYGYGYKSWPTYEKGWRYVRPFQELEDASVVPYYYVKLNDIQRAVRFKILNEGMSGYQSYQTFSNYLFTLKFAATDCDYLLYEKGEYHSPDYMRISFVDTASIALLILIIINSILLVCLKRRQTGGVL